MSKLSRGEIQSIRMSLNTERDKHLPKWKEQAKFISPARLKEGTQKVDGRKKDQEIINNQAGRSLRTFVSGMMNGATPRNRPWFNVTSANPSRPKTATAKGYYSEVEKIINNYFSISNLYRVLPLAYKDVGVFSNAAFAMLPDAITGFHFYPFAIGTYAYACDSKGRTNMFTRDFTLNVRQVVETYAGRNPDGTIMWNNIPEAVQRLYEARQYLKEIVLCNVIIPNSTYNPRVPSLDPLDKKFQSYTYMTGSAGNGVPNQNPIGFRETNQPNKLKADGTPEPDYIKVGGYNYFPVITPRWEVEPEGYYGIDGPGEIALSDIKTLQKAEEWKFEAIEKIVRPPMVGHSSLRRHRSSILAGGITYVDDRGMQHGFKRAFDLSPQISELVNTEEKIEGYIKSAFFEDLFRQMSSEPTKSHVTAVEVSQRTAETMAAMAPVLGQWDHDMSGPLIENAQIILGEQGRLPQKPEELQGDNLVPEYISVLAQASKASSLVTQEKYIGFVASTAQALGDPTLLMLVNGEAQIRQYAENLGVDPSLTLNENEYAKVKQQAAQAQAAQAAQQQAEQQANTAKTLSETQTGNGSALDQLAG